MQPIVLACHRPLSFSIDLTRSKSGKVRRSEHNMEDWCWSTRCLHPLFGCRPCQKCSSSTSFRSPGWRILHQPLSQMEVLRRNTVSAESSSSYIGDAIYENKDVNGKRLSHSKMSIVQKKKKRITKKGEHPQSSGCLTGFLWRFLSIKDNKFVNQVDKKNEEEKGKGKEGRKQDSLVLGVLVLLPMGSKHHLKLSSCSHFPERLFQTSYVLLYSSSILSLSQ